MYKCRDQCVLTRIKVQTHISKLKIVTIDVVAMIR